MVSTVVIFMMKIVSVIMRKILVIIMIVMMVMMMMGFNSPHAFNNAQDMMSMGPGLITLPYTDCVAAWISVTRITVLMVVVVKLIMVVQMILEPLAEMVLVERW